MTALALFLAALLNAQNIYKSVYNQPEGTQREVALAFAGPLREVSMALRLDRPRAWVESATGREHATIDTEIVPPPPLPAVTTRNREDLRAADRRAGAVSGSGEKPEKVAFTPRNKMRLWIAGDSLVITPACGLLRALGRNDAVETVGDVDGRVATGLTRPGRLQLVPPRHRAGREEEIHTVVFSFRGTDDHDS